MDTQHLELQLDLLGQVPRSPHPVYRWLQRLHSLCSLFTGQLRNLAQYLVKYCSSFVKQFCKVLALLFRCFRSYCAESTRPELDSRVNPPSSPKGNREFKLPPVGDSNFHLQHLTP